MFTQVVEGLAPICWGLQAHEDDLIKLSQAMTTIESLTQVVVQCDLYHALWHMLDLMSDYPSEGENFSIYFTQYAELVKQARICDALLE